MDIELEKDVLLVITRVKEVAVDEISRVITQYPQYGSLQITEMFASLFINEFTTLQKGAAESILRKASTGLIVPKDSEGSRNVH